MPQLNTSNTVFNRLQVFFQRLIAFANYELIDGEYLRDKISIRWTALETRQPKLIVKSEIRFLAALVAARPANSPATQKEKDHLKQDLRTLKDFVGCLEDNRDRTQGSLLWHFTLLLWDRTVDGNLTAFEQVWQQKKGVLTQPVNRRPGPTAPSETPPKSTPAPAADSSLDANRDRSETAHNLPPRDYGHFVGRAQALSELMQLLSPECPIARISLCGLGGMGKTTLALETAYRCLQQAETSLPATALAAIVFVSAQQQRLTPQGILPSYRYSQTLQDLLRAIAKVLALPIPLPSNLDRQIEQAYDALSRQRTLLIVDDLDTLSEQNQRAVLSFLYGLPSTVKVIVTSRVQLTLDAVIPIGRFSQEAGERFIAHQSQLKSLQLTQTDSQQLIERTGGIPAAMLYALGQVAVGYPLPQVLPSLSLETSDYCRYYLENAVNALTGQPAHSLLLTLSLFPGSASRQAIANVSALSDVDMIEGVASLRSRSLIRESQGRFTLLPLTQDYLLTTEASEIDRLEVRSRWLDWHQQYLTDYITPQWRSWQDYSELDLEWKNCQSAVDWCIAHDDDSRFSQLWPALRGYTHLRGYWQERLSWMEWWRAIAQQKEDPLALRQALRDLGWTLTLMGNPDQLETARDCFDQAWSLRDSAPPLEQVDLAIDYAVLCLFQRQLDQVNPWLKQAEALLSEARLSSEEQMRQSQRLLYYSAQLRYRQGDLIAARDRYQQLASQVQQDNATPAQQQTLVYCLNWLIDIALQQGDISTAEARLAESWPIIEDRQDLRSKAFHLRSQALLAKAKGDINAHRHWCQQARQQFSDLNMQPQAHEMSEWLQSL